MPTQMYEERYNRPEINENALPRYDPEELYGETYWKKGKKGSEFPLTNAYVVPYNPYLTLKYECHINVEDCYGQKCVNYVLKYITKGKWFWNNQNCLV